MEELERYEPELGGRIAYEHLHRYAIAKNYVAGAHVLDVACGEGYGTALLADAAASVTGIDLDDGAISRAKSRYAKTDSLSFICGDAEALPLKAGSVDVVVSFETIEHLPNPENLVREIKRVLKKDGLLILSMPNRPIYNKLRRDPNPFHINEMDEAEGLDLLRRSFSEVEMIGQRMAIVSLTNPLGGGANAVEYQGFTGAPATKRHAAEAHPGVVAMPDPEYLLFFCSNRAISHPVPLQSVYLTAEDDLWMEQSHVLVWASGLHDEDELLRQNLRETSGQVQAMEVEAERGRSRTELADAKLEFAQAGAKAAEERARQLAEQHQELGRQFREASAQIAALVAAPPKEPTAEQRGTIVIDELRIAAPLIARLRREPIEHAGVALLVDTLAQTIAEQAVFDMRLDAAQAKSSELDARASSLRAECETAKAELGSALAQLSQSKADLTLRQDHLTELVAEREALEATSGALHQELAALAVRLEDASQHNGQLEEARNQAALDLKVANDRLDSATGKADDFEARSIQLQEAALLATQEAERQRDRCSVVDQERTVAVDRADKLTSRLARIRQSLLGSKGRETRTNLADDRRQLATDARLFQSDQALAVTIKTMAIREELLASLIGATREIAPLVVAKQGEGSRRVVSSDQDDAIDLTPVFDAEFYQAQLAPADRTEDPIAHFRRCGWSHQRPTHPIFQVDWMRYNWPTDQFVEFTLERFLTDRRYFSLSPHPLFDPAYYLERNPGVSAANVHPIAHYLTIGWREGRQPSAFFNDHWYLARHRDVIASGTSALTHFASRGAIERRHTHPHFDADHYLSQNPDIAAAGVEPFTHFALVGWREGRTPNNRINDLFREHGIGSLSKRQQLLSVMMNGADRDHVAPALSAVLSRPAGASAATALDGFEPPQALTAYLNERFGKRSDGLSFLLSIVKVFENDPATFDNSELCRYLVTRIQDRASSASQGKPVASIVIPVFNNLVYTLTCILSVLEAGSLERFEILIADDSSTDDATPRVTASLGGVVRLVRQEKNLGFLGNCNAAAAEAIGEYVVFLNNDTIVLPGWLDALLAPFDHDGTIGLTGSKLLNGDGTLQEAGGVYWSDGSAWNYGRNQDPRMPEFNYLKDVDYCSGASIALPRRLWQALGGFDPIYQPAYCEDSDIAFRVRALGRRTVYVPHSEVIHHEGRSHGRDVESGIKAYQLINQEKLFERWQSSLKADNFPNGEMVPLARDRSRHKPHILVIDHYVPQWDRDAGSRSIYHYMKMLIDAGFHVTFWPDNLNEDKVYTVPLQAMGVEVIYSGHFVGKFQDWLDQYGRFYKYAWLSRPHIAEKYIGALEAFPDITRIYYGVDLHFMRIEQQMKVMGSSQQLKADVAYWKRKERDICSRCAVILFPGHEEVEIVRRWVEPDVKVLALPIVLYSVEEIEAGRDRVMFGGADPYSLMFVGGFAHTPNVDSIIWFVKEVMPLLVASDERYRLTIVGSNAPAAVVELATGPIDYVGRLSDEDLATLYEQSGISIAPLLYGGGVKGKVIEAMAKGIPIAMTSIGGQGLIDASDIAFVGDNAPVFAENILLMTANPAETRKRSLAALDFIETHYSIEAAKSNLATAIPELASSSVEEMGIDLGAR